MANHASHAALPYPIKNARYTLLVPMLDADGDPTAATTPDTEISEDNAAATDAAEEISATSGMDGMAMLTLSGAETDCSTLAINFKNASGPKYTLATLYPRVLAIVGSGTLSAGSAGGGTLGTILAYDVTGCFIRTTGGTGGGGTGGANNQCRKIITYTPSTGAFTVSPNWETTPSTDTTYDVLLPEGVTLGMLKALNPTTAGRTLAVESDGMAYVDCREWLGGTIATPTTTGVPEVDVTYWRGELVPATAVTGVPKIDVQYWEGSNATADLVLGNAAFFVGTADSGSTTTLVCSGLTQSTTDHWKGAIVRFTSGTNDGLCREVTGFTPASDTLTWVDALPAAVAASDTFIIKPGALKPWNAAWDAEVQSEVDDALVAQRLDELLNADSDIDGAAPPTVGSVFHELLSKTAGSFTFDQTTDSLEALRDTVGTITNLNGGGATLGANFSDMYTQMLSETGAIATAIADVPTVAEFNARTLAAASYATAASIAALNNLSSAQAQTAAESALQTYHLDHLIASADPGGVAADSSFLAKLVSKSATPSFASYNNATDSLEALRDRGDAAWITATGFSTHSAADVWAVGTRALTDKAGFSISGTTTTLDALQTALNSAHGSGSWATATGFAVAGDAMALTSAERNSTADAILVRSVTNTQDTADAHSLTTVILAMLESSISGTTWTIRKTGGTTFTTKTITVDAAADPITGVT